MRKVLKITSLVLALVMALGMFAMAFAADSKTVAVELPEEVKWTETTALTAKEAAAAEKQNAKEEELTVIWTGDIDAANKGKAITFTVDLADGTIVDAYHKGAKGWEFVAEQTVKDKKVTFTFNDLSPVALVVRAAGSAAPQTGDSSVMLWGALMVVAAAAAVSTVVISKKRKIEA